MLDRSDYFYTTHTFSKKSHHAQHCFINFWNQHDVLRDTEYKIVESLLFGYTLFTEFDNKKIFNATITFIISSKRFDGTVFYSA